MLNTKLNLYNTGWLDVVFDKRNKTYGAYDLRQHYAGTMIKAMGITFSAVLAGWLYLHINARPIVEDDRGTIINITPQIQPPPIAPVKKVEPPKPEKVQTQPKAATRQFLVPKPTSDPLVTDPPKIVELTGNIGSETQKGDPGAPVDIIDDKPAGPPTAVPAVSNELVPFERLEVQPEPYGGMEAFGRFLGKNLKFPAMAADAGVGGRVIVSFVIERDGSLTNIIVERGAGYGMDQEAARVLKLAKAWKPGIQNGQPVRVRYTIPINFQLPE